MIPLILAATLCAPQAALLDGLSAKYGETLRGVGFAFVEPRAKGGGL